ncbi:hypothetical protein K492DRAFT_203096 [Lichtheimia hyalospora FSU 10163]|nr:hypothetical protein K492DRAFT_203096 [Lichtheimia hyalospora FSU 10163]
MDNSTSCSQSSIATNESASCHFSRKTMDDEDNAKQPKKISSNSDHDGGKDVCCAKHHPTAIGCDTPPCSANTDHAPDLWRCNKKPRDINDDLDSKKQHPLSNTYRRQQSTRPLTKHIQNNNQQRRNTGINNNVWKRGVWRSSADYNNKRAPVSSSNNTNNRKSNTIESKVVTRHQQQPEERLVKTDEIALFMRCKRRYADIEFRSIPPSPGGWEQVKPDRVVAWGNTAENYIDFSSYLTVGQNHYTDENDDAWKKGATWIREFETKNGNSTTHHQRRSSENNLATSKHHAAAAANITNKLVKSARPPPVSIPSTCVAPPPSFSSLPPPSSCTQSINQHHHFKSSVDDPLGFSLHPTNNNTTTLTQDTGPPTLRMPSRMYSADALSASSNALLDRNSQPVWDKRSFRGNNNSNRLPATLDIKAPPFRRMSSPLDKSTRHSTSDFSSYWTHPSPITPPGSASTHDMWSGHNNRVINSNYYHHQSQEWTPPISPWSSCQMDETNDTIFSAGEQQHWEDRFASILKVVDEGDDDTKTMTSSDAGWAKATSLTHQQRQRDTSSSDSSSSSSGSSSSHSPTDSSTSDGMAFLVANMQLVQNMVQTGGIGCRYCGSGSHAVARECPYISIVSSSSAWAQLFDAARRGDQHAFLEALDVYSKACPTETLQTIGRKLFDARCPLQLIALNTPPSRTTILVDLQGNARRTYTATPVSMAVYNPDATCRVNMPGFPLTLEENLARLADAGLARDLTEVARCSLCKQQGHWIKDCSFWGHGSSQRRSSLLQHHHYRSHSQKQHRLSVDVDSSNSHRLYYNLNEYVLVEGI